jgi:excisionase family DNA binding protein
VEEEEEAMPKLDGYLRIREAAAYLGVSPNTLRNWGRGGKLAERRHPMNGYRLYSRKELDELLAKAERPANERARRKPK